MTSKIERVKEILDRCVDDFYKVSYPIDNITQQIEYIYTTPENEELLLSDEQIYFELYGHEPNQPSYIDWHKFSEIEIGKDIAKAELSHCKQLIEAQTREKILKEIDDMDLIKGHNHPKSKGINLVSCPRCTFDQLKSGNPIEE